LSRNTSKFSQVRLEITEMTGSDTSRAPNICRVKEYNKARLADYRDDWQRHQQSPENLQGQKYNYVRLQIRGMTYSSKNS
jgi:hypothetical protein